jgi:putative ABC transport system permease protein
LLLSLAVGRRKELAVRSAIGASRRALIEQLLTESALLMALSVILGAFMGWGVLRLLPTLSPDSRLQNIGVDWNVLGYTFLIAVFSILLFGLAPALFASRFNLNETLKQAGKGSNQGGRREKMRDSLVVCEIALALMLLMVAGLLIRSYIYIKEQGPGFNFQDLTMLSVSLPQTKYPDAERQVNFYRQLRDRLTGLPGVEATAVVVNPPLTKKGWETSFVIENGPPPGETPQAQYHSVSDSYFNLMRIPLLRGRQFTGQPMKQPPPEAIINTALQKRFFPNSDPLGKQLELFGQKFEIVGIVSDVRHFGFEAQNKPEIYVPFERNPDLDLSIVVRSRINPKNLLVSLQNEVWQVDKELPINVATMDQLFADSIKQQSFTTLMFGLFAIAAVTLASAGLFGVMAYSVSQRTQEIGIRMALGAQKRDIFRLVLVRGLVLVGIGLGIGVVVSMAITRLTQGLLYGVSATDPLSALLASILVVLVALVSCYIPARRAVSVDPLVVLRSE